MKFSVLLFALLLQSPFPISKKRATQIVKLQPKVQEILKYNYPKNNKGKIVNELLFEAEPSKSTPFYTFEIRQIQPEIQHSVRLESIRVDARNGKVYFYKLDDNEWIIAK